MLFLWLFLTLIIVWHKCGQRFFFISCMKNTTVRWWSELQQKSAWLPHRYLPHLPPLHRINTCINVTTSAAGVKSSLVWKNQKFTNKGNVSKRRCPLHHFLGGLHDLRVVCQQNSDDSQNYRLTHIKPKKCVSDTWFKKKKKQITHVNLFQFDLTCKNQSLPSHGGVFVPLVWHQGKSLWILLLEHHWLLGRISAIKKWK